MKKLFTITGDVKTTFKLQDVNLSLNNFWSFFRIWNEVLSKNGNLTKTFLLDTFGTTTLGVYNTGIYEIHGVIVFHKDSHQMVNFKMKCLEITTYAKTPMK